MNQRRFDFAFLRESLSALRGDSLCHPLCPLSALWSAPV